jgi:hypothetical protein
LRRGGGRRVAERDVVLLDPPRVPDDRDDEDRDDDEDLVEREPLPPRVPRPLEVFEAAVRFAILHTVVGFHHMSHFCHTGTLRDTGPRHRR